MARSLLIMRLDSLREAARVQRHVRSSDKRAFSERAAEGCQVRPQSRETTFSAPWSTATRASDTSNSAATAPPQPAPPARSDNAPAAANNGGSQNAAPAAADQPATIPAIRTPRRDSLRARIPSANANAAQHSESEVRQLEIRHSEISQQSHRPATPQLQFFNRYRRLGATRAAATATNAIAIAIPVTVAVTARSGCAAHVRQCHCTVGDRRGSHRRQHSTTAAAPAASSASSAQAKIDAGATAAVIADPTATAADARRDRPDATAKSTQDAAVQASTAPASRHRRSTPQTAAPATTVAAAVAATAPVTRESHILQDAQPQRRRRPRHPTARSTTPPARPIQRSRDRRSQPPPPARRTPAAALSTPRKPMPPPIPHRPSVVAGTVHERSAARRDRTCANRYIGRRRAGAGHSSGRSFPPRRPAPLPRHR